jgi:hypothetical protein
MQMSPTSGSTAGGTNITFSGKWFGLGKYYYLAFGSYYTYSSALFFNSSRIVISSFPGQFDTALSVTLYVCSKPYSSDVLR